MDISKCDEKLAVLADNLASDGLSFSEELCSRSIFIDITVPINALSIGDALKLLENTRQVFSSIAFMKDKLMSRKVVKPNSQICTS